MKRDLSKHLVEWKQNPDRKPLLLLGACQVGKTHLLKAFGKQHYTRTAYLNFEETPELKELFNSERRPAELLKTLSIYVGFTITPQQDLLILDEIQESNAALTSLKYFHEHANQYHIVGAGSLLGVQLSKPGSFPVGQVNLQTLYPMSFLEYLEAMGKSLYRERIETVKQPEPLPELIHTELIKQLRHYLFTGGMPEVVRTFRDDSNPAKIRRLQKEILRSYELDFGKHAGATDIPKINLIWDSIPRHLGRENKKFMFSAVKSGARAREYENALNWLEGAGLLLKCSLSDSNRMPLKAFIQRDAFKVYLLDVGLLGAMVNLDAQILVRGDAIFNDFKGSYTENFIAQQLRIMFPGELVYWRSENRAEIDFLIEAGQRLYPLEVKSGINPRSKSLQEYRRRYQPELSIRSTLQNLKYDGEILNIPLYAINNLPNYLSSFQS